MIIYSTSGNLLIKMKITIVMIMMMVMARSMVVGYDVSADNVENKYNDSCMMGMIIKLKITIIKHLTVMALIIRKMEENSVRGIFNDYHTSLIPTYAHKSNHFHSLAQFSVTLPESRPHHQWVDLGRFS